MILDTCGLIWLVNGGGELSQSTLRAIRTSNVVYVSAASAFEIGCKVALGRLKLTMAPEQWYAQALDCHDLLEVPVDGQTSLLASSLPMIHKDPADRLIIATALIKSLPVVTHDGRFAQYGVTVLK